MDFDQKIDKIDFDKLMRVKLGKNDLKIGSIADTRSKIRQIRALLDTSAYIAHNICCAYIDKDVTTIVEKLDNVYFRLQELDTEVVNREFESV